jgi:predicted O-linked N-acetylglucosamine transferase (SPINDLY family)
MAQTSPRFLEAIRRIDGKQLDVFGLIGAADGLTAEGEQDLAIMLYKYWMLANPQDPLRHVPAFNAGSMLLSKGDLPGAQSMLAAAVEANPDFYGARLNLASAIERAGERDKAVAELNQLVERLGLISRANIGSKVQALRSIARMLRNSDTAERAMRMAVEIDPTQTELAQHWANNRQSRCMWPSLEAIGALTFGDIIHRMAPLSISAYTDDPLLHMNAAINYTLHQMTGIGNLRTLGRWPAPARTTPEKLKIGYLSSDFCNHAVGYLISDIFQFHDKSRYEISVFNIGERTNDPLQTKIMGQVDQWHDIRPLSDKDAARKIVDAGIDILIDMNGHTNYQRTRLLAMRPAPIIANWLGYPGTMGSDVHDYIIADDFIIPPAHADYYTERVLHLPCYQPNGRLFGVPQTALTRADLGLPETGVVFCCFNGAVKIIEPVFSRWMSIMRAVPGSVLWLRGINDDTEARLRKEAEARGVAGNRLLFLAFRSNTEYLGCHRYADLFLDTFPYGAHTTASDCLRMGVPMVTLPGLSFPSRVCGSLMRSAGIAELICATPEEYVAKAIELGNNPAELNRYKRQLAERLPTCVLFDPQRLTVALEGLFQQMWTDYCQGAQPQPNLPHDLHRYSKFAAEQPADIQKFFTQKAFASRREAVGQMLW